MQSASLIVRLHSDATHGNCHLLQALPVPTESLSVSRILKQTTIVLCHLSPFIVSWQAPSISQ
jgi:hypothetical protein